MGGAMMTPAMKYRQAVLVLVLGLLAMAPIVAAAQPPARSKGSRALHEGMRKLWSDHVVWTRQYIVDAAGGLGSADATSKRLPRKRP